MASEGITAKYGVELDTSNVSGSAASAADAMTSLRDKIKEDTKALSEMKRAMRNLKGSGSASTESIKELQGRIDAQKASVAKAQEQYIKLGGTFGDVGKSTKGMADETGGLLSKVQGAPGPLGQMTTRLAGLRSVVAGGAMVGMLAALAAVIVAVTAAVVAATAALASYVVGVAGARREELLQLEAMTKVRNMYGFTSASATELQESIDAVSGSVALGRDKVGEYARQIHRMGLRGDAAEEALEVMSITGSAAGDRIAKRFAGMAAGAAHAGESIQGVADDFRSRFGPIAEKQALSVSNQMSNLKENISQLFSNVKIEGFLKALNKITSLFSQQSETGKALKATIDTIVETIGGPMNRGLEEGSNFFRDIIRLATLGALVISNKFLDVEIFFLKHFGPRSKIRNIMEDFTLKDIGEHLLDGFIEGITGSIGKVINAIVRIANTSRTALRKALRIESPSRVFADLGGQVSAGMAEGVDSGAPKVRSSMEDMAEPPQAGGVGATGGAGGSLGGPTLHVSIGDIHVNATSDDPDEIADSLRERLAQVFEGVLAEMGGSTA